jgi:hypothetical protein
VLVAYAAFGFLVLPSILRSIAIDRLGKLLGRRVEIAKVETNPFTLSATVHGLKALEPDGGVLIGFDRLYANFDLLDRLTGWWGFAAIELEGMSGRLSIGPDGTPNIADIVKRASQREPAPGPPAPAPRVRVDRLRVAGATLGFVDHTRTPDFAKVLGPYSFSVEGFRSEGAEGGRHAFEARTESGETLAWDGTLAMGPLRSEGNLRISGVDLSRYAPYHAAAVGFDVQRAILDLRTKYRLSLGGDRRELVLEELETTLRDIGLVDRGSGEVFFSTPQIRLSGGRVDLFARRAEIPAIESTAGRMLIRIAKDGAINLERMLPEPKTMPPPAVPAATASEPAEPFAIHIASVAFTGYSARFEDLQTPRPIGVDLSDVSLQAKDASTDAASRPDLTVKLRFENGGTVEATGQIVLRALRGSARAALAGVPLAPFDPFLEDSYALRIAAGTASGEGTVTFDFGQAQQAVFEYHGDLSVDGLRASAQPSGEEFLRWRSLSLAGVAFSADPPSLAMKTITLGEPVVKVVLREDGRTNLQDVLRIPVAEPEGRIDEEPELPTETSEPAEVVPTVAAPALARPITIGKVSVKGGAIELVDRRTEPAVALRLDAMTGTLDRISTDDLSRGDVDLAGRLDGVAPFSVAGRINPLIHGENSDFTVTARGIEMTRFGPYAEKWAGWTIARGKLDLDLHYTVASRLLTASNVATFLPFELGTRTESPDATHLPVKLGLALLRDGDGRIVVDLPVSGSLDDPKFKLRRVVLRALVTVFKKAATSPFKLLAGLGGKDDAGDLERIEFAPGLSEIDAASQAKLEAVAKALAARPGLTLEIAGGAGGHPEIDALRRVTLPPEPEPTPETLAAIEITLASLRSLADARATRVRDWLVGPGGIDPARVLLTTEPAAAPGVTFALR